MDLTREIHEGVDDQRIEPGDRQRPGWAMKIKRILSPVYAGLAFAA
jgi:hypothetical protein